MSPESTFCVTLLPGFLDETRREAAIAGLVEKFGLSREKAASFLEGPPRIIRKGLTRQQAHQFQKAVIACGLDCLVQPEETTAPVERSLDDSDSPEAGASDLPCCPNCGYRARNLEDPLITAFNGMGQCPACDIIVAKYRKAGNDAAPAEDDAPAPAEAPAAPSAARQPGQIQVPVYRRTGPGRSSGRNKLAAMAGGCLVLLAVIYIAWRIVSGPDPESSAGGPAGSHAARSAVAEAQQDQMDHIEALETSGAQIGNLWFEDAPVRIAPGETWEGILTFKLPFETAFLTIPPATSNDNVGERMYRDLVLEVENTPWLDRQISVSVISHHVSSYYFPIWVIADGSQVTHVMYSKDRSISLEQLGQVPQEQLANVDWDASKGFPKNFNPVFDLVQGQAMGLRMEVSLMIQVPEAFADYTLGKQVKSRAETVYLKGAEKSSMRLALTLAKKRGEPDLYVKPGKAPL